MRPRLAPGAFTQVYAGSMVCAPSRASLMTGRHQGHATVRGNSPRVPLRSEDVTVAEVLREAGYRSAAVGKWGPDRPRCRGPRLALQSPKMEQA